MTSPNHPVRPALSEAQRRALTTAVGRERGNICPVRGVHGCAEKPLIEALARKGYVTDAQIPYITPAGRAALAAEGAGHGE